MSGGRPRQIYRETVEVAIVLHEQAGWFWPKVAARLKVDAETIARAVRRGPDRYPSFYRPDHLWQGQRNAT